MLPHKAGSSSSVTPTIKIASYIIPCLSPVPLFSIIIIFLKLVSSVNVELLKPFKLVIYSFSWRPRSTLSSTNLASFLLQLLPLLQLVNNPFLQSCGSGAFPFVFSILFPLSKMLSLFLVCEPAHPSGSSSNITRLGISFSKLPPLHFCNISLILSIRDKDLLIFHSNI